MSIRLIALDLYRLQQEVEKLERALEKATEKKKAELKDKLRKLKAERNKMKKILEGKKERPEYRQPR
ncbi:MAG: hypothetical protein JRE23_16000 [Deltaproteobacteria bacterium]|nr:hypothetical protein [Deltaproteobacteria bacterium]